MTLTADDLEDIAGDPAHDGPPGDPAAHDTPPHNVLVTDDGYLYDADTGEVLGYRGERAGWRPTTADDIEWALSRRAEIEADLAAARLRRDAVLANMRAIERSHERRLEGWDWRFRSDVVAFARESLAGKSRTAQFENGKVAFRTAAGTNRIVDQAAAVAFVEAVRPEAVKVEKSVGVKAVLEVARETSAGPAVLAAFLHSTGPGESVAVDTGIAGAAKSGK